MKHKTKLKAGFQCRICTERSVSFARGKNRTFEKSRNGLQQILTTESMRQQKNDFTPVPLTKTGFKERSYCQANLSDFGRNFGDLFVNGQFWVNTISRQEFPGIETDMQKKPGSVRSGFKRKLCPCD